jgi:hypothetical protein
MGGRHIDDLPLVQYSYTKKRNEGIRYHTLQEGETLARYIEDAEQAGDQEVSRFFRDVQEEDRKRAERAKEILRQRLGRAG